MILQNNYTTCLECRENIDTLICPRCISKSVIKWTESKKEHKDYLKLYYLNSKIIEFLEENKKFEKNSQLCISCKKSIAYICPYCFSEMLIYQLKRMDVEKKLISEFMFLFNFDFYHNGYTEDLKGFVVY